MIRKLTLCLVPLCLIVVVRALSESTYSLTIRMKDAVPTRKDDLLCTGIKLDSEESYIVKVDPHASRKVVHHMSIYGCKEIANNNTVWDCHLKDNLESENSACHGGDRDVLFTWSNDAPAAVLPDGVGFRVSGRTDIHYLVMQIHYASVLPEGVTDNSGVTLTMTHKRPPMQAAYVVLANYGSIPPKQKAHYTDSYCKYERDYPIYPIAYRTHSHELGYVASGYRVRDGQWMEIGRTSPQLAQTFYDISNPGMEIRRGDELAARCTMNSMDRDEVTNFGPAHLEEMCIFYIMYATYNQDLLVNRYCLLDANSYSWFHTFDASEIPANAGSLKGIAGSDEVLEHFNMTNEEII